MWWFMAEVCYHRLLPVHSCGIRCSECHQHGRHFCVKQEHVHSVHVHITISLLALCHCLFVLCSFYSQILSEVLVLGFISSCLFLNWVPVCFLTDV
jgi:hypothetical protein